MSPPVGLLNTNTCCCAAFRAENSYKTNTRNDIKSQQCELFNKLRLAKEQVKYRIISELLLVCCGPVTPVPPFVVGAYRTSNVISSVYIA